MTVFIIQSESGKFLDKHLVWVKDADSASLFRTPHKDVALNQLIEINTRDISLRARVVTCATDNRGLPDLASLAA